LAKKLFIAAVDKNSGKTTSCIGLMHLALKRYRRVGFFKPFGGQTVVYKGKTIDKDVALMARIFGLKNNLEVMSPVVLHPGATAEVVDGKISPADLQQRIISAYAVLEKQCDLVIIEGSGHPGVGSVLQISNARIARLLDAPVLLVTGGGLGDVVDRLALITALFEKEKVDLRAILVNKLIPAKRARSLDYLSRALQAESFKVLGGFDYQPILANPTLRRISSLLNLPIYGNRRERQRIIFKVLIGAASTQRVMELLLEPSLILVTSSRDELLVTLAHLYQMPQTRPLIVGLVISGNSPVSNITQQILDRSKIPYMRAENYTSAELYKLIDKDVAKIVAEDSEKIGLIRNLAEVGFDFDSIDELFSK
jgi:BioD-like phosphotransacetylase family protein